MVEQSRRDLIKRIAKGAIYASPVVYTMAAPVRLLAQGPSSMMNFCDHFPVLCMIFGNPAAMTGGPPGFAPPSGDAWPPAPGQPPNFLTPPPGSLPPGRDPRF